ncbi:hypothetical protein CVT24_006824 [Panaeolus cyanescens]|uniref:RxLR effector protein n=1 Tax=Panaeolus cyanescens TaxID=181874 RepID=A0A409YRY9_9AGAR|nr:hypothetical protein CVT24_006824 [Panaeolus cyanescens]
MKLAFTTLLVAGVELALLANVGSAYPTAPSSSSQLAARASSYGRGDVMFSRSMSESINDFSTRSLIEELKGRVERRETALYRRWTDQEKLEHLKKKLAAAEAKKDISKTLKYKTQITALEKKIQAKGAVVGTIAGKHSTTQGGAGGGADLSADTAGADSAAV